MKICGLQKLTLLDFPGRMACTVFLNGCNFRCPYCHNSELLENAVEPVMTEEALLTFLRKRQGILEGVCVTGGEPTLHPELPDFLRRIKALGYRIKLDTNGYRPAVMQNLIREGLVDYVAMDIKNSPDQYGPTVGLAHPDLEKIEESIRILLSGEVEYEFRTTLVRPLHSAESVAAMGRWLWEVGRGRKAPRLFLQPFVDRDTVPLAGLAAPNTQELEAYLDILAPYVASVSLRGV